MNRLIVRPAAALVVVAWVLGCFTSCSSPPISVVDKNRNRLFPFGTYRHSVSVTLKKGTMNGKPDGPVSQQFSGVVDLRKDRVKIIATSPFGTTLFRLSKDGAAEPSLETDLDALKKAAPQIKRFMQPVLSLLNLPVREHELPRDLDLGEGTRATFSTYDAGQIPREAKLTTESYVILVKVEEYVP